MKAITQTESRALAALLTETINCFSRKPELTGAALVRSLGKRQRWFDPALLKAYIKLSA